MIAYLLGLFTIPALAGLVWCLIYASAWFYYRVLAKRGITIEVKRSRKPSRIQNMTLRKDIWFERQLGLIFHGHWYRTDVDVVNRWIGIGSRNGRCIMFFKRRTIRA